MIWQWGTFSIQARCGYNIIYDHTYTAGTHMQIYHSR